MYSSDSLELSEEDDSELCWEIKVSTLLSLLLYRPFVDIEFDPDFSELSLARSSGVDTPDIPASRIAFILSSYLFHL